MTYSPNNHNNLSYTQRVKLDAEHESKYASNNDKESNINPTEEEIKILNTAMDSMFTFAS